MSPWLTVETQEGRALRANGREIRPIAWSMQVKLLNRRFPFGLHFKWVRPRAVEVRGADGTSRIPIPDLSLYIVWGTALFGVLTTVAAVIEGNRARTHGRRG